MGEPPDLVDNEDRASWADSALRAFAGATRVDKEEMQTQMQDLIADLFHLAHRHDLPVNEIMQAAVHHYECEREEAEGKPCVVQYEREPWMEQKP